ncbi:3-oxoacyl-[acyl-carrier-protein] synthase I, chloroplastic-like [Rutidosis leptorrhynchoides]|uniref:3-oxoacyl-[acyl-carrier-protein] synthase I, chloroplastic-like n=1 Tax=Rutidosis leptorrhynchoides TaxID=125765 RepID=UPI003A996DBA
MEVQTYLHFTHLSAASFNPVRNNILSAATIRLPARTSNNRHHLVFASQNSNTAAPKREKDAKKRIVITGMGLVSVFGNDVDTFYERLLSGDSGIDLIDRYDASDFTTRFAGQIRGFNSNGYIDAKYDKRLYNCQRYCIVAGKKALEDTALDGDKWNSINKERAVVLIGSGLGGITVIANGMETMNKRGSSKVTPYAAPFSLASMGPALLAIDIGFMGPKYSISAACATSNSSFCAAASYIREGKADLMIAGGVDALVNRPGMGAFAATRSMSKRNNDPKTACRPWDKDRDGLVMGEGGGVLVMESLEHAMRRDAPILAEYLGGAVTCDAYHIMNPPLDGLYLSNCIESSIVDARVSVEEVNYVNAHATSTVNGELAELNALKKLFKNTTEVKLNATTSMIGHSMGGSGGHEAIATIKAIQTGWLHPTINQFDTEPAVEFDIVANQKQKHEINVGISNSSGIGGHNSVVVFSSFKP